MPSNSNRTKVGLSLETTPGTINATPTIVGQRVTGVTPKFGVKTDVSKELRSDRQYTDVIRVGSEPSGTIPFEVSHGAMNTYLECIFLNALTTRWPVASGSTAITGVTVGPVVYAASGITPAAGDIYCATGFTNQNNNGIFVAITGSGSGSLEITNAAAVAETPPATARLKYVGAQGAATAIAATSSGGLYTLTGVPASITGLVAGEWVRVGGNAAGTAFIVAPGCNGWCRLAINQAGTTLTFDIVPTGWAADPGTGQTIQIFVGEYVRPGTNDRSYSMEVQLLDLVTPEDHYYSGMRGSKMTVTSKAQALVSGSLDLMGQTATITTTRVTGAVDVAALQFGVMSASNTAGRVLVNGASLIGGVNAVMDAEITMDNQLFREPGMAFDGSIGIGIGRNNVQGKINFYYGSFAILQYLRNNLAASYMSMFTAGDDTFGRQGLLFDVPRLKFLDGDPTMPAIDTPRMLEMNFQGILHPTLGYTVHAQVFEGFLGVGM